MTALMEIRNLAVSFGGLQAVKDFSLTLREGQLLGLIGPNGAGKTTIFNLVCGFYQPGGGTITFRGKATAGLRPHEVTALGMARTFQNIRMWKTLTVKENLCISQHSRLGYGFLDAVAWGKRYRERERRVLRRADELLEALSLGDAADEIPGNLPYGRQRRVEIGRALAAAPRLLLLDEPAAGMNPRETAELIELIGYVRKKFNLAVWLIEHSMKVVMSLCERITVIDFGEVIAAGGPAEIREDRRVIKAYLGEEGEPDE